MGSIVQSVAEKDFTVRTDPDCRLRFGLSHNIVDGMVCLPMAFIEIYQVMAGFLVVDLFLRTGWL